MLATDEPTFRITPARRGAGTLVFASPHSGTIYPKDMGAVEGLPEASLRSAEDAAVDALIETGPEKGAALIVGLIGRAYIDLNRAEDELDPALILDCPRGRGGAKTEAGYGVAARLTGDGRPLYDRRLTMEEVRSRIARAHRPYHEALAGLMRDARERTGRAVLVDWHSMPARAAGPGGPDVVLGDRHGSSCGAALSRRLRALFEGLGWRVALNRPYAGGHATQLWGRPEEGYEAIQIELNRRLYLDEETGARGAGYGRCKAGVERVIQGLCDETG